MVTDIGKVLKCSTVDSILDECISKVHSASRDGEVFLEVSQIDDYISDGGDVSSELLEIVNEAKKNDCEIIFLF